MDQQMKTRRNKRRILNLIEQIINQLARSNIKIIVGDFNAKLVKKT